MRSTSRVKRGFSGVAVRFRPLLGDEKKSGEIDGVEDLRTTKQNSIKLSTVVRSRPKTLSFSGFDDVFDETEDNACVYRRCLMPLIRKKRNFGTVCCFAYGHSGSGKSHTIVGYENKGEKGVFTMCIEELCESIQQFDCEPLLNISFAELLHTEIYDLLNNRAKCEIRDDGSGNMVIRSQTIMNKKTGTVRVNPLSSCTVRSVDEAMKVLRFGIDRRAVGSSTIHDESSRSHGVMVVEVVTRGIMELREKILQAKAAVVPHGRKLDDLNMAMFTLKYRNHSKLPENMKKHQPSEEKIKEWLRGSLEEGESLEDGHKRLSKVVEIHNAKIAALKEEEYVLRMKLEDQMVGSNLVFVDLAGSDYDTIDSEKKLSGDERKVLRNINQSLLALKECIRAINSKKSHVPFRNSKLTLLLKKSLLQKDCKVVMIATCSPANSQAMPTFNTLRYAQLVAKK